MPNLEIKLQGGYEVGNIPIAVEVIDADLEPKWRGAIRVGEAAVVPELEEGLYRVEASLPSGRKHDSVVRVETAGSQLTIPITHPPIRASLEWAAMMRPQDTSAEPSYPVKLDSVWHRLWGRQPDGPWRVLPLPEHNAERKRGFIQYRFPFRSEGRLGQYYLQVGGPDMRWRLVALPADDIRVLITPTKPSTHPEEDDSAVDVSISSEYPDADVLIGYLRSGAIDQARQVSELVITDDLLEGKRDNPIAVVVAGYYLLRINDLARLHQVYMTNLANWLKWLPDSAVIDAWYLMRASPPDFRRARERLLEATARGMPIYYRGLRILIECLTSFEGDPSYTGPDVHAALMRVRRYAAAADVRATTTTFIGVGPELPGEERLGVPDDTQPFSFFMETEPSRPVRISPQAYPGVPLNSMESTTKSAYSYLVDPHAEERSRNREANREVHIEKLRSGRLDVDDPQRTIARLLRAEDAETQTERLADNRPVNLVNTGPVKVLAILDHPLHFRGMAAERIAGRSTLFSVSYLSRGRDAAWTVGCMVVRDSSQNIEKYGSAFLVSPRLVLTCHRLLSSIEVARQSAVDFDFEERADKKLKSPKRVPLDPDTFFLTDENLDFSLVALSDCETPIIWGWNSLIADQGKAIIGEWLSVVQHVDGAPKQLSLRGSRLVDVVDDFLHFEDEGLLPSLGAPFFNDQWEVVGIHHASIPARDPEGRVLARNGEVWDEKTMDPQKIRWLIHEVVRISSITRYVSKLKLGEPQSLLRDELVYSKRLL